MYPADGLQGMECMKLRNELGRETQETMFKVSVKTCVTIFEDSDLDLWGI